MYSFALPGKKKLSTSSENLFLVLTGPPGPSLLLLGASAGILALYNCQYHGKMERRLFEISFCDRLSLLPASAFDIMSQNTRWRMRLSPVPSLPQP